MGRRVNERKEKRRCLESGGAENWRDPDQAPFFFLPLKPRLKAAENQSLASEQQACSLQPNSAGSCILQWITEGVVAAAGSRH